MFRKSATTLSLFSKSVVSSSLKSITPIVSAQQPFSSYVTPNRGWFEESVRTIKSGECAKIITSKDPNAAEKQTSSLGKAIAKRSAKLEALKSELNRLSSENEKDKAQLANVSLYTKSRAEEIVKSAARFEKALIDGLAYAVANKQTSFEFDYIKGDFAPFLATVFEEYNIKFHRVNYQHPVYTDVGGPMYEFLLPDDLQAREIKPSNNEHPVYGPWLNQFREKLNQAIAPEAVQEYSPNMRPML